MGATPTPSPLFHFADPATNLPLVGGKVYTYTAETTTPTTTWADAGKLASNLNPVTLDANGDAKIYIDGAYKFVIKDAAGNLLATIDDILGGTDAFDRNASGVVSLPFDDITSTDVQAALEELGGKRIKTNDSQTIIGLISKWLLPAGMLAPMAMTTVPAGWLECDGASYLRASYTALFAAISTTWGSADGTHFNVPETRGEWLRGWDHGRGIDTGRTFASAQAEMIGPHTHTGTTSGASNDHIHLSTNGGSRHGTNGVVPAQFYGADGDTATQSTAKGMNSGGVSADHAHIFTTNNNAGTENRVRNKAVMYCIATGGI